MPDFDLTITSGATLVPWVDPPSVSKPTRINPLAESPHLYWKVIPPDTVRVKAIVNGAVGPADGSLGGRLFFHGWSETPAPPPTITPVAGFSSQVDVAFTTSNYGHHLLQFIRPDGGSVLLPIMAEP